MIRRTISLNPTDKVELMQFVTKAGVTLADKDVGGGSPPMLFVHGCGCDHTHFAPQIEFFGTRTGLSRLIFADMAVAARLTRTTRWLPLPMT